MLKAASVFLLCLLTLSACQSPFLPSTPAASSEQLMQVSINGQSLSESQLHDFLIQKVREKMEREDRKGRKDEDSAHKSSEKNKKSKKERAEEQDDREKEERDRDKSQEHSSGRERSPELLIQDVLLTETGSSIFGADATEAITPDFAGKEIQLTLQGTFKKQRRALPLKDFRFTLDPELIQQSFIGRRPKARVLLDDSILLQVDSASDSEVQAWLNTERIPDFYLKGLHRISVEYGNYYTDALIQVGAPEPVDDLSPRIESVEILRDEDGKALHIRLSGDNFMLFPKFSYALIDGEFGFGYQTEVLRNGGMETVVHVPDPRTFDDVDEHLVIYATPFGVVFQNF